MPSRSRFAREWASDFAGYVDVTDDLSCRPGTLDALSETFRVRVFGIPYPANTAPASDRSDRKKGEIVRIGPAAINPGSDAQSQLITLDFRQSVSNRWSTSSTKRPCSAGSLAASIPYIVRVERTTYVQGARRQSLVEFPETAFSASSSGQKGVKLAGGTLRIASRPSCTTWLFSCAAQSGRLRLRHSSGASEGHGNPPYLWAEVQGSM